MAVLFFGPLLAPLFQATRLPLLADSGTLAHDLLTRYICPTPAKSYMLLGFPMAVCARCWGATIGIWAAWWLLRNPRIGTHYRALPLALRFALPLLAFGLWWLEIRLWIAAPLPLVLLNGIHAGLWGALLGSLWQPNPRAATVQFTQ